MFPLDNYSHPQITWRDFIVIFFTPKIYTMKDFIANNFIVFLSKWLFGIMLKDLHVGNANSNSHLCLESSEVENRLVVYLFIFGRTKTGLAQKKKTWDWTCDWYEQDVFSHTFTTTFLLQYLFWERIQMFIPSNIYFHFN